MANFEQNQEQNRIIDIILNRRAFGELSLVPMDDSSKFDITGERGRVIKPNETKPRSFMNFEQSNVLSSLNDKLLTVK